MTRMPSYFGSKAQSFPLGTDAPTDASIGRNACAPPEIESPRRVAIPLRYHPAAVRAQADFRRRVVAASRFLPFFLAGAELFPAFFPWSRLAWRRLMRSITGVAVGSSGSSYSIFFPFILALMIFLRFA